MSAIVMHDPVLAQLRDVPPAQIERLGQVLERISKDPTHHGVPIKKLKDRDGLYRFRLGNWRVFIAFGTHLEVLAIQRRTDTTYSATKQLPEAEATSIGLSGIDPADFLDDDVEHDAAFTEGRSMASGEPLPRRLTPDLLAQWRIPEVYRPALVECETADELLELTIDKDVLATIVELLFPSSIDESAKTARYLVHGADELIAYAEGRLSDLLLLLDDEQLKLVSHRLEGPAMVRGGPGTGKTVIALYRVQELARRRPRTKILFATYTKTLAKYARELLQRLLEREDLAVDLTVETVDRMVYRQLGSSVGRIASEREPLELLNGLLRHETDALLQKLGARYLLEEFDQVIEAWGVADMQAYLAAARDGRRVPLYPEERQHVWRLYTAWRATLKAQGMRTWNQLRQEALRRANPAFDAVFVDEAQDLTPVALRFLLKLARDPKGIYLTADANQSIYQTSFSWRRVDEALDMRGKVDVLRRDYRTTQAINGAVRDVAEVLGLEVDGLASPGQRAGPTPRILALPMSDGFDRLAAEITATCLRTKLPLGAVAVLAPRRDQVESTVHALNVRGIDALHAQDDAASFDHPAVKVITLKSAKGLEFPIVFVTHMDEGVLPRTVHDGPVEEYETYRLRDAKEFFVASSRAMRDLVVTYTEGNASPFIEMLTPGAWDFQ